MVLILKIILTILLPPLGVLAETGLSMELLLNILLTLLGYFPGLIHGIWILARDNRH